jgi:hypothetical protein
MTSLSFQPVQGPLYQATVVGTQKVLVYWLWLTGGTQPTGNLDSAAMWTDYSGCYIFIPADKAITGDPTSFINTLTAKFAPQNAVARCAAWLPNGQAGSLGTMIVNGNLPQGGGSNAQTIPQLSLPLANITLLVPTGSALTYDPGPAQSPDTPALTIQSGASPILLQRPATGAQTGTAPLSLAIPLCGPSAGATLFDMQLDRGKFCAFFTDNARMDSTPHSNEIRYFYGAAGNVQMMNYPVFPPTKPSTAPNMQLALNVSLDPMNVWDSTRTIFGLDVSQFAPPATDPSDTGNTLPILPISNYFSGTDGHPLVLVPQQGAGYAFSMRPPAGVEPAGQYAYLSPAGVFDVAPATQSQGLAGADPATFRHMMCGMTGTEYLIAEPGATVEFCPGNTAYAAGFTSSSESLAAAAFDPCTFTKGSGGKLAPTSGLVTDTYTTSWIQINPSLNPPPDTINYGYAVQPEAAVYYSKVNKPPSSADVHTPYKYPLALGCRVSQLEDAQTQALVQLPMAAYGGVWLTGASSLPSAADLQSFESQIIGTTRHSTAPMDEVNGPTFFDPVTHAGFNGGFAKTPEGLLAQLNDDTTDIPGTFQTIFLATSPNVDPPPIAGAAELAFQPPEGKQVVNPTLSNALMNDNLFMVATNYEDGNTPSNPIPGNPFGTFLNEIQMGEWTFRLDVGYTEDQTKLPRTTLIFKFTTALNVMDLVNNQAYWQNWDNFIDKDQTTAQAMADNIQVQLNAAFCQAKPDPTNPDEAIYFADFWQKINDPNWTGILAINCGLDAGDLPPDLQDLLGGINGELRAHHFGITINQVNDDTAVWNIDQSSMFALVYYNAAYAPPPIPIPAPPAPKPVQSNFGFQVLKLDALFENSVLTHFDSKIAVTIPQLFGENVSLDPSAEEGFPNVLEINGVYQKHGTSGTVVFNTTEAQVFQFVYTGVTGIRVIQEMHVTDAALVPVSSTTDPTTKIITVLSNLALSGQLIFIDNVDPNADPPSGTDSPLDIFSYGDADADPVTGLDFNTYNIAMTTEIQNNVGTLTAIGPDLSSFMISPATSTYRPASLVAALPLKLTSFLQGPSSDGWPVTFAGDSSDAFAADYALSFQVSLGSLGALSAFADSLEVDMILGWQKAGADTTDNQMWLLMVPPATMLGQLGFGIQGVLSTNFTEVELVSSPFVPIGVTDPVIAYGVYFKNVSMEILGLPIIPGPPAVQSNFTLFADPSQGNASNMGWLMTLKAIS